jgi:OOP family OmpA-OmpF porin
LNPNFAVEAGYFNLGKSRFVASTTPAGTLSGEYQIDGLNMDLVGTVPLSQSWAVQGRLGIQYANSHTNLVTSGAAAVSDSGPNKRESNLKVGLGLQYEVNRNLFLRAEVERYHLNDGVDNHGDVNVFTVGLVIPFGRPAETRIAAAPAYVPSPAQVPAPVAEAPAPQRVQFSADSLFTFDRSTIGPTGEVALATFGQQLKGTTYDSITVEGHTDRLGSSAYNQRLSLQRAEAVKANLVTTQGVPEEKVKAVGLGESNPVTQVSDCPGNKATAAMVACLQPDRRVEVNVVGTR